MPGSIEKKGEFYYTRFRYGGRQHKTSLHTDNQQTALRRRLAIDDILERIRAGETTIPLDVDPIRWIASGGRLQSPTNQKQTQVTIEELLNGFLASAHHKEKAESTRLLDTIHVEHLRQSPLKGKRLALLAEADLQKYVEHRQIQGVVGRTIKKELATFRAIWNGYGLVNRLVPREYRTQFPRRLALPKFSEKPPFMTMDRVKTQVDWRSVYLRQEEAIELLKLVQKRRQKEKYWRLYPWVYYAVHYVLHTSARRSSMTLQRCSDIDFENGTISIRVRKEKTAFKETRRVVPMMTQLSLALEAWLDHHPGGDILFTTTKDKPLTPTQAHLGLKHYLQGTKFEGLSWHNLRHSFVSVAASMNIPLDVIREFTGHTSEDTLNLYKHLNPALLLKQVQDLYRPGTKARN